MTDDVLDSVLQDWARIQANHDAIRIRPATPSLADESAGSFYQSEVDKGISYLDEEPEA